jgi:hypothetical protein
MMPRRQLDLEGLAAFEGLKRQGAPRARRVDATSAAGARELARRGFAHHGRRPAPAEREAAASLECRLARGLAPRWVRGLLDEVYRGDLAARIDGAGRVHIAAASKGEP